MSRSDRSRKGRDPSLPPMRVVGGRDAGERCGVVFGRRPPCGEVLSVEAGDRRGEPRCPVHCRAGTRNADALSDLCPAPRMRGRRRCKHHGGKTRVGPASPSYVDGRSSRWAPHAPGRYADLARQVAAGDPLDLTDDIHMVSARIAELLQAVDAEGSPQFVKKIGARIDKLYALLEAQLSEEGFALFREVRDLLDRAARDYSTWGEVSGLFAQRVKMVESQRKRDLEGGKYVTADDMVGMVRAMGLALRRKVEEHVPDKQVRDALLTGVSAEFAAIQGVDDQTGREAS